MMIDMFVAGEVRRISRSALGGTPDAIRSRLPGRPCRNRESFAHSNCLLLFFLFDMIRGRRRRSADVMYTLVG